MSFFAITYFTYVYFNNFNVKRCEIHIMIVKKKFILDICRYVYFTVLKLLHVLKIDGFIMIYFIITVQNSTLHGNPMSKKPHAERH